MVAPLAIALLVATHAHAASSEDSSYNFLAMGDWGDDGAGQKAAAVGLGVIAEQIEAKQVHDLVEIIMIPLGRSLTANP